MITEKNLPITRRTFIKSAGCSALTGIPILSTILNLKLLNQASASNIQLHAAPGEDYKTLVCVFMQGGNDSFNTLVPTDDARYAEYASSRSNLALARESLLSLNQAEGGDGLPYGLHGNGPGLQQLFNGLGGDANKRRLSFIANIGTLVEPVTLAQYKDESTTARFPKALFSHIDQEQQWQTSVPQGMDQLSGWGGRIADLLHNDYNQDKLSMSIALSGKSVFQIGKTAQQFVINENGAQRFTGGWDETNRNDPLNLKNFMVRNILEQEYSNMVRRAFAESTNQSIEQADFFQSAFEKFDESTIGVAFPNSYLGGQLKAAFKSIVLREQLGLRRQTLFIATGGFDTHLNLLSEQAVLLDDWSRCLLAFQTAIENAGLQDSVLTFSGSDFGRTLRSNGRGTDHAWGGNSFVMGGQVNGGRVYGTYPNMALDGPDDIGQGGRFLPSTSVDVVVAEIAQWFGVSNADLPYVLPNIGNFHTLGSDPPIGFIKQNPV
ncbi:MAG: DUF1501 domain-containing protein [Verrucomicrobia bacterium]|nr:DUF1501 domain-containing protein [Verrucomicrobiota bacterium]